MFAHPQSPQVWVASYYRKWITLSTLLSLLSTPYKPRNASKPCGSTGRLPETEAAEGHVCVYVHTCAHREGSEVKEAQERQMLYDHFPTAAKYWSPGSRRPHSSVWLCKPWHSAHAAEAFRDVQQGVNISTSIKTNVAVQFLSRNCRNCMGSTSGVPEITMVVIVTYVSHCLQIPKHQTEKACCR